jgi:hypothetical protein
MSFAGSRYLQGVEKFETDALGIPNIYFVLGNKTSDVVPTPTAGFSQTFSGCYDISNIYGLNRDGTELDDDGSNPGDGGSEAEYTRFLRIKSDNYPFFDPDNSGGAFQAYSPGGGYTGGAQGYRAGDTTPVLDPTFGLGVNPGDFNTANGIISGIANNRISGVANAFLSRFIHANAVDNFNESPNNASSRNTVAQFDICDETNRIVTSPQFPTPNTQQSNQHGHGYVIGCCRIEREDPIQDADLVNLDAGVTAGFFTLVAGETGSSSNNPFSNDHKLELHRHLSSSYEGPHDDSSKWNPDFTTADEIEKALTLQFTTVSNAISGVDNDGNPLEDFSVFALTDLNIFFGFASGSICTNSDGHIFANRLPFGKMIKIVPNGNDFASATFSTLKHSILVRGAGGYEANGTEKEDPNKLPVSLDGGPTTGPKISGMICDTPGQFNIHEIDANGNSRRLSDRVLLCFCVDALQSPWAGFYDNADSTPGPDYNQGLSLRGLYIVVLDETKTKVAYDSNNPNWDYRAIYFYPVIETSSIGPADEHTVMFPFASDEDGFFGGDVVDELARVRTGSATLRPNFPEH